MQFSKFRDITVTILKGEGGFCSIATKLWKFLYTSFMDPLLVFMRRYWVYLDLRNFFLNFHTSPAIHRDGLFLRLLACNFISFLSMWYIFFVISLKNWFLKILFTCLAPYWFKTWLGLGPT